MKQLFGVFSLLILVSCQNNPSVEPSKFKTITLKSYGEVETLPNMATFNISLNCLDKSIKSSKKCLVDKSNELQNKLLTFKIDKDDILTTSVNMSKSYTWINNSRVFEGFRGSTTVFVTIRNIDELDDIYTELLENRNLDLGGLSYSHTKIDSLKNEAYLNAFEKSEKLSDRLMQQIPESKKEILKIGNIEINASMPQDTKPQYEMNDKLASNNTSIAINKGTIKITATLYVEYQIK
ncbi:SIMPL domain-containing protein [Psychroflexus sp. MBR-150]|jgi:uncharacterized protein YggE